MEATRLCDGAQVKCASACAGDWEGIRRRPSSVAQLYILSVRVWNERSGRAQGGRGPLAVALE